MNKFAPIYILTFLFVSFFTNVSAQIFNPVKWSVSHTDLGENEYELHIEATIKKGWHLYSQIEADPENFDGPLPTEFVFAAEGDAFETIGETSEPFVEPHYDEVFKMDILFFKESAVFTQKIKSNVDELPYVDVEVFYMVCDDERCLNDSEEIRIYIHAIPEEQPESFLLSTPVSGGAEITQGERPIDNTEVESLKKEKEKKSLWTIFIVSFLFGFVALLTPCVFPMIPLTVSFFTKQSKTRAAGIRNAIIYGISIVVIYVFLGWLITWLFGADALNALSTDAWFNVIFFIILVVFAISFFGAFEIRLPNSWANKVDKQAGKGGMIGIFFMALALAIVSFSCTGPIVGSLLIEAATSGGIAPIVGMLGFSLAIALPFMLFAMIPGWMNSLPKSGGWLNTVKVVLGFLELALAFKFLSNADLVLQLHLLEREVFLAFWIAIFGTMALYLFGKIKLPHDSSTDRISVGRLLFGIVVLTFTIYLIPGLWGAPLKIISGFPPPMTYSESPYGVGNSKGSGFSSTAEGLPQHAKYGPHDIISFIDYEKGMAYARQVNKPVLIDFTGHACVNCRKMEERVWAEPQILSILKTDIVLISLYVDERKNLPENEQYVSPTTGKKIRTVGNKWSDFQIKNYQMNAQPYYVLIDLEEKLLNDPVGYMPNVDDYEAWLREGIDNF